MLPRGHLRILSFICCRFNYGPASAPDPMSDGMARLNLVGLSAEARSDQVPCVGNGGSGRSGRCSGVGMGQGGIV